MSNFRAPSLRHPSIRLRFLLLASLSFVIASVLLLPAAAHAEEMIIKQPGSHPSYSIEIEPEAIIVFGRSLNEGPGAGVRLSIPIVRNGFISSINDNVGISFGADKDPLAKGRQFWFPLALQWNFWLATHWSVFGEAGISTQLDNDSVATVHPAFYAGGRFHLSEVVALTAHISLPSLPAASFGVSFFL